jgi:hypothetical protein
MTDEGVDAAKGASASEYGALAREQITRQRKNDRELRERHSRLQAGTAS